MLRAVIFDMDGVIVDSEPLHHKAYQKMFDDYGLQVSNSMYESFTGKVTLAICEKLCTTFNLKLTPETLINRKREHFNILFEQIQLLALHHYLLKKMNLSHSYRRSHYHHLRALSLLRYHHKFRFWQR